MTLENDNVHHMIFVREHEGIEEWHCPICTRHLLVNWKPEFKRTVLEIGDPSASHGGFKGGTQTRDAIISPANETSSQQEIDIPIDESSLTPWVAWLDGIGFDDLWNRDDQ
jgi:hypothetical protein